MAMLPRVALLLAKLGSCKCRVLPAPYGHNQLSIAIYIFTSHYDNIFSNVVTQCCVSCDHDKQSGQIPQIYVSILISSLATLMNNVNDCQLMQICLF